MEQTAEQIFNPIRKQLYKRLHALARPLSELTDVLCDPESPDCAAHSGQSLFSAASHFRLATDGHYIFWNSRFLKDLTIKLPADADSGQECGIPAGSSPDMEALLLHQVIHCLFGHPFSIPFSCPPDIWSLACDISAWHILSIWTPELLPYDIGKWLNKFSEQIPDFPLYQTRRLAGHLTTQTLFCPAFHFKDSHKLWPVFSQNRISSGKKKSGEGGGENRHKNQDVAKTSELWNRLRKQLTEKNAPLSPEKKHQKKSGMRGNEIGNARRQVKLTNTRRHNYRNLLKTLARRGEEMKLNSNEFQYASYLYGLEHYDGMPFLEPLEYEETAKIRELAIVIDTSASCSHSLTRAFLEETRNLLLEEDLFFHPFHLHIIQCDTKVERDDILTSQEDLKDYIDTLEICGMGGTDFRPAFSHIRHLQDCHEFSDLSAILFFTDGSGLYPPEPPDARCVFVFLEGHYEDIDVPDWAEILVL